MMKGLGCSYMRTERDSGDIHHAELPPPCKTVFNPREVDVSLQSIGPFMGHDTFKQVF